MSEDEAIKRLQEILDFKKNTIDKIEDPIEKEIEENCYIEEMPFKAIETILDLYKQEKEWTEKAIQTSKMYKEYWINLGNKIKQIRHKAKSRVDYDLADVIRDLTKIIGDE